MTFFKSFDGWEKITRGKKRTGKGLRTSLVAHFTRPNGQQTSYNGLESLNAIIAQTKGKKPPKKFKLKDHFLVALAIQQHPDHSLTDQSYFKTYEGWEYDEGLDNWYANFTTNGISDEGFSSDALEQEIHDTDTYRPEDIALMKLAMAHWEYQMTVAGPQTDRTRINAPTSSLTF